MGCLGLILVLALAAVGDGKMVDSYGSGGSGYGSGGSGYGSSASAGGYNEMETKCTPYPETTYEERCETFNERVCYTTNEESCVDVQDQNCRGVVSSKQVRQCFDVNELICGLKEDIQYQTINAEFTVQKCQRVAERVCDTVYEPRFTAKDDFQCINVRKPSCTTQERQVLDKTCKTVTKFDCGNTGSSYGGGAAAGGLTGVVGAILSRAGIVGDSSDSGAYSTGTADYGAAATTGSASGTYGSSSYDYNAPSCKKTQDVNCYTTPRTVSLQVCNSMEDKICEKLSARIPVPGERQACHDEQKNVCELERRQQPKQVKTYVYTKQCKTVPRKVCENAEVKELMPSCVPTSRKQCSYSPRERCEEVPKQHCYKAPKVVMKQRCETVMKQKATPSYNR